MLSKLLITLMAIYPVIAYFALWLKQPLLVISYLLLIFFLFAIDKCINKHWFSGAFLFLLIGLVAYSIRQNIAEYLVYLPPILILLSLFLLFSQSLLGQRTPLITRYAILLGDKLENKHLHYNRSLTIIWSVFFLIMAITSILLALFFSQDTWSLFTHIISYILVASLFIVEFTYRKYHFSGEIKDGFFQFIGKIIKIRPSTLLHK